MLSFWKVMLKSPTFWPFFSTNLSQKHKINFLSSMKLVTVPQKLFPNPKSNFTICEKNWQWLELVWQRYNCFSIFPIFHFSSRLPICVLLYSGAWCLHLAWLPAGWLGEGTLPTLHMNTLIAAIWTLETQHGQIRESSDDIYCKGQVYVKISPKYKLGRQSQYEASVMKRGVGASRKVNKVAAKSLSRQKQKAT